MEQLRAQVALSFIWLSLLSILSTSGYANSTSNLNECRAIIGAESGNDDLPNYVAGHIATASYPSGHTYIQYVYSTKNLVGVLARLARRMKVLSRAPHLEAGFREVGAFVFEFESNRFQIVLHTLNQTSRALDEVQFNRLFSNFALYDSPSKIKKIFYLHTHPDITDPRILKYFGANPDPRQSRASGLPWESAIMLSEEDIKTSINLKAVFEKTFNRKIPYELIALPTVPRFDQIYFSYTPQ